MELILLIFFTWTIFGGWLFLMLTTERTNPTEPPIVPRPGFLLHLVGGPVVWVGWAARNF